MAKNKKIATVLKLQIPAPIEAIRPSITTMFVRLSCIFLTIF